MARDILFQTAQCKICNIEAKQKDTSLQVTLLA